MLSCDDHRIPAVSPGSVIDRLRIKSITQEIPDMSARVSATQKVSMFSYDAQNRLSMILTYQTPDSTQAPVEQSIYTYDAQNRLTQLRREIVRRSGTNPTPVETYLYSYNIAGQVSQLDYNNNLDGGDNSWKVLFQYHPTNVLKSSAKSFSLYPISYREESEYTFTGRNLTQAVVTSTLSRAPASSSTGTQTINFTHDTGLNPFYGVFVIPAPFKVQLSNPRSGILDYYTYFGGFDNLFNLSRNNVLSDGTNTYAYTYNSANLPTSRTTTSKGEVTEILTYDYESY
ncbi:hypothetical protein GCM10027347_41450 [Larkinella harenae]